MTEQFARILRRYGRTVDLERGGTAGRTRAFVQRLQRRETDAPEEASNFGASDLRRWLYIGPAEEALCCGDTVAFDGGRYTVQTAAAVYVGAEKSHWWAILRPEREALA